MLSNYTEDIKLLKKWHEKAKTIAIEAESMDSLNKAFVQPLHEFRYCLDHFMRSLDYEESEKNAENIKKSLRSAIGHLQRTYSDSIEWMLVNVMEEYLLVLNNYTNEQIEAAFPEYYKEVRPELEKITRMVNDYKKSKSVEKATEPGSFTDSELEKTEDVANQFVAEKVAENLRKYLDLLHNREISLIEAKARDKRENMRDKIIFPIITAVAGAVIASTITTCFFMFFK